MGDTDVMGDGHHHYTLLTNSHDGSGSVNVLDVLVRIVCSNALNYTFKHADFKWSYVHKDDLQGFGDTAYRFINAVSDYTSHPVFKQDAKIYTLERAEDRILTGDPILQKA